jgi:thioredoxin reductase
MMKFIDPKSVVGKLPRPEQKFDLLVVGAGPAGIAAALKGAAEKKSVCLVDEHPVTSGMAGLDVPYFFGGRASAALTNQARMIEQVAAMIPSLDEVFDAGVEVMLGVSVWGAWVAAPGLESLPCRVAGLATDEKSWLVGFDEAVIAAGARDLVVSFAGSDQPGVMGAQALYALLNRYEAFAGRRLVILGSGKLALETALLALEKGLEVAAVVEVRDAPQGPAELVAVLQERGVTFFNGYAPLRAETNVEGVVALEIVPVAGGGAERIACDTVCLALGVVPSVELLDVLGVPLVMDGAKGGFVPVHDADGATPIPGIFVAGDCAGVAGGDLAYRMDWMRILLATGGEKVLACTCEEVTRADVFAVNPPAYLGPKPAAMENRDLRTLLKDGPVDHDQMKRLTRVSMGPCQARRCREQIAMLLAIGAGTGPEDVKLAGYRAPVRPLSLAALAAADDAATHDGWDVWFGIPAQWVPYADIGTAREAEHMAEDAHL